MSDTRYERAWRTFDTIGEDARARIAFLKDAPEELLIHLLASEFGGDRRVARNVVATELLNRDGARRRNAFLSAESGEALHDVWALRAEARRAREETQALVRASRGLAASSRGHGTARHRKGREWDGGGA